MKSTMGPYLSHNSTSMKKTLDSLIKSYLVLFIYSIQYWVVGTPALLHNFNDFHVSQVCITCNLGSISTGHLSQIAPHCLHVQCNSFFWNVLVVGLMWALCYRMSQHSSQRFNVGLAILEKYDLCIIPHHLLEWKTITSLHGTDFPPRIFIA
jgi:hypothetical protein